MIYWIIRPLLLIFYKLFYRVKVFGKENLIKRGKNIVICNHLCKMDVFVVSALYPNKTTFLSKIEWYKNKFFGWLLIKLGTIPIDRDKPSFKSIKDALTVLKNDKRLGIFPEGRRNFETNELQEIKEGVGLFAVKGKSLITPIIIYDRLKMFKKTYVIVGKPIDLSQYYDKKFNDEVSKQCADVVNNTMHELQSELFKIVEDIKTKKKK